MAHEMLSGKVTDWRSTFTRASTEQNYYELLGIFFDDCLASKYPSIDAWVARVIKDQKRRETRNRWTIELKQFIDGYRSKRTGHPPSLAMKLSLVAAVKHFLKFSVGKDVSELWDFKLEDTVEAVAEKASRKAMNFDEVRALYNACMNNRDRAVITCLASTGMGPREFIQFTHNWHDWFDPMMQAPRVVSLVREKKLFPYHVTLWEDAVDAIKTLFNERLHDAGPRFRQLFVNYSEGRGTDAPMTQPNLVQLVRDLRERASLREGGRAYRVQKIRPHAFRHYFRTQARLRHVDPKVAEFCLGHQAKSGDPYGYDRSHLEPEWVGLVELELRKMTESLNIVTGRAQKIAESKEQEIRIKAMREFYNTLLKAGMLKPETLSPKTLEIICKAVGVEVSALLLQYRSGKPPAGLTGWNENQGWFHTLAKGIGLDDETYNRYMDALKVVKPVNATVSWENTENWWTRTEVGSDDYMKALSDHFFVEDKDGSMRILRKAKPKAG